MTPPAQVGYDEILRVWQEADGIPVIEHAWLFDHLIPIFGDPDGPVLEGWTTLAALAASTTRLRMGLLVSANRVRPPALLARMAATVDVISGGRLDFGIGVGSRPDAPIARREYAAHGLPFVPVAEAVAAFTEAVPAIRRLWTEEQPFDLDGKYVQLKDAYCNPKPVQRPGPPIVIGGRSAPVLRVVAEHADIWNMPGGSMQDADDRSALLDRYCERIGRNPAEITRSLPIGVSYDRPDTTRAAIAEAIEHGFTHLVLSLPSPYPPEVAAWVATELAPAAGL
ncbi:LLM class flavin-dependent oxidoreductase [Nakamurella alba]|nr:LLM class flavin-dependent oxidoreductase [Nakamurella alba]